MAASEGLIFRYFKLASIDLYSKKTTKDLTNLEKTLVVSSGGL